MHQVYLEIGGNIGDKRTNFLKTYARIEKELGPIQKKSAVYESPPWGFHAEENFWNQVVLVKTFFLPEELLPRIHHMESLFNRKREAGKYTSREMDIDILYFDDIFMETNELVIPHPRLHQRLFVLVPLAEIAPELKHPLLRLNSLQMLENCRDESIIQRVEGFDG